MNRVTVQVTSSATPPYETCEIVGSERLAAVLERQGTPWVPWGCSRGCRSFVAGDDTYRQLSPACRTHRSLIPAMPGEVRPLLLSSSQRRALDVLVDADRGGGSASISNRTSEEKGQVYWQPARWLQEHCLATISADRQTISITEIGRAAAGDPA